MYTTGDILQKLPEISRDVLYNWIAHGYLDPIHTPIGNKGYQRKAFSEADYLKIRLMWKFYQERGMPPRMAALKAEEFLAGAYFFELSVDKTFQQWTLSSGVLRLSPNERFEVIGTIEAYQLRSCEISVSFPSQHLSLQTSNSNRQLQLDIYEEIDVHFPFRAIHPTEGELIQIQVHGQADEVVRVASIPVEVNPLHAS
jgi:hypothetical protein